MTVPAVSLRQVSKDYAVRVLDAVDLDLMAGEVHSLVGANGAGKSTLCQILAGNVERSEGVMAVAGEPWSGTGKRHAEEAGIQIVQQELNLLPTLSVAENLFLSHLPLRLGRIDYKQLDAQARDALAVVGLDELDPRTPVAELGVGTMQLIEIAAALVGECRLLILDEPTAALTAAEADRLFDQVRELRDRGVCVLYVSHRLDEVVDLSDRVTVLRDGRQVATLDADDVDSTRLVGLMIGDDGGEISEFRSYRRDETALAVTNLTTAQIEDVSFTVKRGERVGLAGLVGSGRTETLRAIFGADELVRGSISVTGVDVRFEQPRDAVRAGLALVTEDRKQDGLLLARSIRVNGSLAAVPQSAGWIDAKAELQGVSDRCTDLDTRFLNIEQTAEELSGGNQQKVVLAKWLGVDADVYLFDEPTRGIDVGARRRIDRLFEELAERGKAMVIVSSDLDELMSLCDSIIAMSGGRAIQRFERAKWSRQQIMAAAFDE